MRYWNFFDLDGSSITIKEIERRKYPTHDEIRAIVVHCVPPSKCIDLLGKEVLVQAAELEDFVFNKIEIPSLIPFRKIEIYNVSGTLEPYKGRMVFIYGLPAGLLLNRLNVEDKEVFYRHMYLNAVNRFNETVGRFKDEVSKNIATLAAAVESCKDIIRTYNSLLMKTLGVAAKGPEALAALEGAMSILEMTRQQAAQAQAAAPSQRPSAASRLGQAVKALFSKLKSIVSKIRARRGGAVA